MYNMIYLRMLEGISLKRSKILITEQPRDQEACISCLQQAESSSSMGSVLEELLYVYCLPSRNTLAA